MEHIVTKMAITGFVVALTMLLMFQDTGYQPLSWKPPFLKIVYFFFHSPVIQFK
jgi:hypothetical protein